MNIGKKTHDLLNQQIREEFASFYTYLAMAAWFEGRSLPGFAAWMYLQSEEERVHAMKFLRYMLDRGGAPVLESLVRPKIAFNSALEIFEASLAQERKVTASIYGIYETAEKERDYATLSLLQWFTQEQVEEEKNAAHMADRLRLADGSPDAILLLDAEAGRRVAEKKAA
jgi:ferritin